MKENKPAHILSALFVCVLVAMLAAYFFGEDHHRQCNRCFGEGVIFVEGDFINEGKGGGYYEEIEKPCTVCDGEGELHEVGKPSVWVFGFTFTTLVIALGTAFGYTKGVHFKLFNIFDFSKSNSETNVYTKETKTGTSTKNGGKYGKKDKSGN